MQVEIQNAAADDFLAIYDLVKNELGYTNLEKEQFESRFNLILSDKNIATFLAKKDGATIGFISLRRGITFEIDGEYVQITDFAVKSSFQSSGIGTMLLQHAESYAKANNIHHLTLNCGFQRLASHAFYERKGFTKKSYSFKKYI
jgi:ribosomal protein S18 acetylase RimI-like enzyme